MKNTFYRYFDFFLRFPSRSPSIMAKSYFVEGCNNHNRMKDKKIQGFSFPNNNDKHLETSIFAVTVGTKCQQLSLSRIENKA